MKPMIRQPIASRPLLAAALLVVVAFGIYANALQGEFVWDDRALFVEQLDMWQWKNVGKLLTSQDNLFRYNDTGFYRPLVNLTFLLDNWIWGTCASGYHLTNTLFHVLATLAVFSIVRRMGDRLDTALVAGLIFAVHPVHIEAVAWINGRNNLVAIAFYLLAFDAYLKASRDGDRIFFLWALTALALSMFSKEYALTFPLLVALWEFSAAGGTGETRRSTGQTLAFLAACMGVFAVYGAVRAAAIPSAGLDLGLSELGGRLLMLPQIFTTYLWLTLVPVDLAPYHPLAPVQGVWEPDFLLPASVLLAYVFVWLGSWRRYNRLFFALGWILVTLLPVLNIIAIPYASSLVSERHLYLPSAGFCMLIGWGYRWLADRLAGIQTRMLTFLPLVFVLVLVETYGFATLKGNLAWRNPQSLWKQAVRVSPGSFRARSNLAIAYAGTGQLDAALDQAEAAVRLNPTAANPRFILGSILLLKGRAGQAIEVLNSVLAIDPGHVNARNLIENIDPDAPQTRRGSSTAP